MSKQQVLTNEQNKMSNGKVKKTKDNDKINDKRKPLLCYGNHIQLHYANECKSSVQRLKFSSDRWKF